MELSLNLVEEDYKDKQYVMRLRTAKADKVF
jgi:hypothetical protein